MLSSGAKFADIVIVVIIMQCILMFQPMYEDIFNMFCKNETLSRIDFQDVNIDKYKQFIELYFDLKMLF